VDLKSRHGLELDAVFCGGGTDEALDLLERQSRSLGLEDRVRTLGYVPDSDVPPLYEAALATVVPSYFCPINLPQLEAISLGSPLVCSDLEACREQFEDAALYCDLERPSNLADHLAALLQDEQVSKRLKRAAGRVSKKFEPVHYYASFARVLDSYEYIRRRWSWLREGS
jgi:glycosyltransferase involved in cell wall biosynthesis